MIPPSEDTRVKISPYTRQRMKAKGLKFERPEGPLTVVMEDEIMHTAAFPVCDDPECCCYFCEREDMQQATKKKPRQHHRKLVERTYTPAERAPLNGNRPFSILKQA